MPTAGRRCYGHLRLVRRLTLMHRSSPEQPNEISRFIAVQGLQDGLCTTEAGLGALLVLVTGDAAYPDSSGDLPVDHDR
jgi:hypothetical protein